MSLLKAAIKRYLLGRRVFQPFYEQLLQVALRGMNIGGGSSVADSGELLVLDLIRSRVVKSETAVIFDVGANIGAYANAVLDRFGDSTNLYCFEPSVAAFARLSAAVGERQCIKCFQFGFGGREEMTTLYSNDPSSGLASVYNRRLNHFGVILAPAEQITLKTIDRFCDTNGVSYIDFLKLDVEGSEFRVLEGAKEMLHRNAIGAVQFEFGGCNIDSRTYFQDFFYLLNPDFRLYRVLTDGLRLVDTYQETHEVFTTTNFVALSRTERRSR